MKKLQKEGTNLTRKKYWFEKGIKDGVPIFLGYLAVSFTLGIAAKNYGLDAIEGTIMSLSNNTSAGEFAALGLIASGVTFKEMAITQAIINLRYLLMSFALSQKLETSTSLLQRLVLAFDVTDEIFGLSISVAGRLNPYYTYGLIVVSMPGWALGTMLGIFSGSILPAKLLSALSVALYGMFIAVIIPPTKKTKILGGIVIVSMIGSTIFTYTPVLNRISGGFRIIILTIVIASLAAWLFPIEQKKEGLAHVEA